MKNLLFYGDSNTWGFDPETRDRYPYELRWTTVCAQRLGETFNCIPAGMNGRTTRFDDPLKGCRNGLEGLDYELQSHKPLDLIVMMLGTNDLKYTNAKGSAEGMEQLVQKAESANERYWLSSPVFPKGAKILLVSPALLKQDITETGGHDSVKESKKLVKLYANIAEKHHAYFMDAAQITDPSEVDGVHLSPEGHAKIGHAVAEKILEIFEGGK